MFADSCQGMEHALQAAKMFNRKKSNNNEHSLEQTTKFLDLHCVGSIYRNQVNFAPILKRLENEKKLIFDPLTAPQIEQALFDEMPQLAKILVNKLQNCRLDDEKDSNITRILAATKTAAFNTKKNQIIAALKREDESLKLSSDAIIQQSDAYLRAKIRMEKRNAAAQEKSSIRNEMCNFRDALSKN